MERDWWKYWFSTLLSCMSTLGFCVIIFYSLGHFGKLSGNFTNRVFRLIAHASYHLRLASLVFKIPDLITSHCIKCERGFVLDALPRSSFTKKLATSSRWSGRLGPQWATMNSMQSSVDSRSNSFFGSFGGAWACAEEELGVSIIVKVWAQQNG